MAGLMRIPPIDRRGDKVVNPIMLYNQVDISVTSSLVNIQGSIYPVNSIGGANYSEQRYAGSLIMGILFGVTAFGAQQSAVPGLAIICGIIAAILVWEGMRSRYYVTIHTSSNNLHQIKFQNSNGAAEFHSAIQQAIEWRG